MKSLLFTRSPLSVARRLGALSLPSLFPTPRYALDATSSVAAQVQAGSSVYEAQGAVYGVGVQYRYAF